MSSIIVILCSDVQCDNTLINACSQYNKNAFVFYRLISFCHYVIWLLEKAKSPSDICDRPMNLVLGHDATIKGEPFALLSSLPLAAAFRDISSKSQLSLNRSGELVTQYIIRVLTLAGRIYLIGLLYISSLLNSVVIS